MAMRNALSASSSWLSLIVALIIPWGSFYGPRRPGSTFTIRSDHMRGSITSPRSNMLSNTSWRIFLHSPYCDVYFSRYWTDHQVEFDELNSFLFEQMTDYNPTRFVPFNYDPSHNQY